MAMVIISCQFTSLDKDFFYRAEDCLSDSEKQLLGGYKKVRRQQQFLAGHYLLRVGLRDLLGQSDDFWHISQKSGAAPVLLNPPEGQRVYLSISHSKDQVCCAISVNNPIGIDIENHQRNRPFIEFAKQYLSRQELNKLDCFQGEQRKQYFYSLWTVMESVAKLRGGLGQEIFDGIWHTQRNAITEDILSNKRGYCTYTASFEEFVVSISTPQLLVEMPVIQQFNVGSVGAADTHFYPGYFLLAPL